MSEFLDILKYILPSLVILVILYVMLRKLLPKEKPEPITAQDDKSRIITTVQLQAYERIILLLERISPNNLLMRVSQAGMKVDDLKRNMIKSVREEFDHNISQQLYISSQAWELVKNAKENMINIINQAGNKVKEGANIPSFSQAIFDKYFEQKKPFIDVAIEFLKQELREKYIH